MAEATHSHNNSEDGQINIEERQLPSKRALHRTYATRSKSCSHIDYQPERLLPAEQSQHQIMEEDNDIDDGNELVEMLRTKFTMKSPKLKLTNSPAELNHMSSPKSSSTKPVETSSISNSSSQQPDNQYAMMFKAMIDAHQNTICNIITASE